MNYIVFDLEWNQSNTEKEEVEVLPFEIIEIGAVKLSDDRTMVSRYDQLINCSIWKRMNWKRASYFPMLFLNF